MSPRCSVYIATSLDGFIARADGSIDWLMDANANVPAGEDCGYATFMSSIDAIVMGRATFEQVLMFPEWPFGSMPVVVVSRTMQTLPPNTPNTVRLSHETPTELLARLATEGVKRVYVDGGKTIQSFLAEGLITDITITTIPILLGSGLPLFGTIDHDVHLRHVSTTAYPFGFVQNTYSKVRSELK